MAAYRKCRLKLIRQLDFQHSVQHFLFARPLPHSGFFSIVQSSNQYVIYAVLPTVVLRRIKAVFEVTMGCYSE